MAKFKFKELIGAEPFTTRLGVGSVNSTPANAYTDKEIERASYMGTVFVGVLVCILALNPPEYLQLIVVFSSSGMAWCITGFSNYSTPSKQSCSYNSICNCSDSENSSNRYPCGGVKRLR